MDKENKKGCRITHVRLKTATATICNCASIWMHVFVKMALNNYNLCTYFTALSTKIIFKCNATIDNLLDENVA